MESGIRHQPQNYVLLNYKFVLTNINWPIYNFMITLRRTNCSKQAQFFKKLNCDDNMTS